MRVKLSKGKTIAEVVKGSPCTVCGTCAQACPLEAIEGIKGERKGICTPRPNGEWL